MFCPLCGKKAAANNTYTGRRAPHDIKGAMAIVIKRSRRVDGIIVLTGRLTDQALKACAKHLPVVVTGRTLKGPGLFSLDFDNFAGGEMATSHLIGLGHRRIVLITGDPLHPDSNERTRGYLRGKDDIERLVVKADKGTPVLIRDIARVELAPDERRGLTELNGEGEVVAGIAMARYGQNALEVIHNLKGKIAEIGPGLPEGVTVQTVYDRSELIHRAIETLKGTLIEESIIVALVCVVFLLHVRSALVAILMLPVGVLMAKNLSISTQWKTNGWFM